MCKNSWCAIGNAAETREPLWDSGWGWKEAGSRSRPFFINRTLLQLFLFLAFYHKGARRSRTSIWCGKYCKISSSFTGVFLGKQKRGGLRQRAWTQSRHSLEQTARKNLPLFSKKYPTGQTRRMAWDRTFFFLVRRFVNPAPREEAGERREWEEEAKVEICENSFSGLLLRACFLERLSLRFRLRDHENVVNSGFPHSLSFVQDEVQTERVVHVE